MYKILIAFVLSFYSFSAVAQEGEEAHNMGALAGAVMACRANKQLYQFEEILSRYYSNTSANEMIEKSLLSTYATAKAKTYLLQSKRNKNDCPATIRAFSRMKIFDSVLYSDGTVKTPDGKYLYPRGKKQLAPGATRVYP